MANQMSPPIGTTTETRITASIQAVLAPTITRRWYARLH